MLSKRGLVSTWGFSSGSVVKNLPAMQETCVRKKEMATYFSMLAWRIPWMEEPGRLQSMVTAESNMT